MAPATFTRSSGDTSICTPHYRNPVLSLEAYLGKRFQVQLTSILWTRSRSDPADAEWVLDLKVAGYGMPAAAWGEQSYGNATTSYMRWTGSLNAAYQVLEHSGRSTTPGT